MPINGGVKRISQIVIDPVLRQAGPREPSSPQRMTSSVVEPQRLTSLSSHESIRAHPLFSENANISSETILAGVSTVLAVGALVFLTHNVSAAVHGGSTFRYLAVAALVMGCGARTGLELPDSSLQLDASLNMDHSIGSQSCNDVTYNIILPMREGVSAELIGIGGNRSQFLCINEYYSNGNPNQSFIVNRETGERTSLRLLGFDCNLNEEGNRLVVRELNTPANSTLLLFDFSDPSHREPIRLNGGNGAGEISSTFGPHAIISQNGRRVFFSRQLRALLLKIICEEEYFYMKFKEEAFDVYDFPTILFLPI